MFGESDSESPRGPSPWDSLTSSPSSLPERNGIQIPKLAPEAEEGNVEYKLQLLSPSPARFARLVTQLKWRLLEGGGQAYYQLGVADSGALVGLPRRQLDESLETLEMMAAEIGASVIVVKEVEVPPELSSVAESQLERWDGKRSARRKDLLGNMKQDVSSAPSATDSTADVEVTDAVAATHPSYTVPIIPVVPVAPIPFLFDPALAIFTMDMGEDGVNDADIEAQDDNVLADCGPEFSTSLKIFSVYKPRPTKKPGTHHISPPHLSSELTKRKRKNGCPPSKSADTPCPEDSLGPGPFETLLGSEEAEARLQRNSLPDERRQWRPGSQPTGVPTRDSMHVPTDPSNSGAAHSSLEDGPKLVAPESPLIVVDPPIDYMSEVSTVISKEPRHIVEALVVRKLLLDEAFLDFEGFSLQ